MSISATLPRVGGKGWGCVKRHPVARKEVVALLQRWLVTKQLVYAVKGSCRRMNQAITAFPAQLNLGILYER